MKIPIVSRLIGRARERRAERLRKSDELGERIETAYLLYRERWNEWMERCDYLRQKADELAETSPQQSMAYSMLLKDHLALEPRLSLPY